MKTFLPASTIAAAAGVSSKTVHRRAAREGWQRRIQGPCRVFYAPPRALRVGGKLREIAKAKAALARADRELLRACAVAAFRRIVLKSRWIGREAAFEIAHRQMQPIFAFSPAALRRWVRRVETGGVAALADRRPGNSGRKAREAQ